MKKQIRVLREALEKARDLILADYSRQSMKEGYWPTVKPVIEQIDAALETEPTEEQPLQGRHWFEDRYGSGD